MRSLLLALLLICVSAGAQENRAAQDARNQASPAAVPRVAEIAASIKMNEEAKKAISEGWTMLRQGDAEIATRLFNKAAGLNPGSVDAYWGLGASTAQQRKFEVSNYAFERALKMEPKNPRLAADAALAYTYFAMSHPQHSVKRAKGLQEAVARFDEAIKLDPGLSLAYANRAVAFAYKGDYDAAWKDIDKAESIDKTSVDPNLIAYLTEKKPRPAMKPADSLAAKPEGTVIAAASATAPAAPIANTEAKPAQIQAASSPPAVQQPVQQPVPPTAAVEPGKATAQTPIQTAQLQTTQAEPAIVAKPEPKQESKPDAKPEQAPATEPVPEPANEPAPAGQAKQEPEKQLKILGTPSRYKGPDKRHCLDLPTNEEIIRCVYPR